MSIAYRSLASIATQILGLVAGCAGLTWTATASAAPSGFPDVATFTQVDATRFARPLTRDQRWEVGYFFFRTPDAIRCAIGPTSWCVGSLPGLPPREQSACLSVHQSASATEPFVFSNSDQPCLQTNDALLSIGQKLIDDAHEITCVVGEGDLTACINTATNHGFVLQPTGSWTF